MGKIEVIWTDWEDRSEEEYTREAVHVLQSFLKCRSRFASGATNNTTRVCSANVKQLMFTRQKTRYTFNVPAELIVERKFG